MYETEKKIKKIKIPSGQKKKKKKVSQTLRKFFHENLGILAIVMIITIPLPRDKNRLETLLPGDRGTQGVSPSTLKGKVM